MAALIVAGAAAIGFSARRTDWFVILGGAVLAVAAWALFQGVVWVIDGFIGNKSDRSSIIWPKRQRSGNAEAETVKPKPAPSPKPALVGADGWLYFLIVILMILSPIALVGSTLKDIGDAEQANPGLIGTAAWANYKVAVWCLIAAGAALKIAAGYRLKKIYKPESVLFAITAIWLAGPVLILVNVLLLHITLDVPMGWLLNKEVLSTFIGAAFWAVVWTAYLKWSRRVRNTYFLQLRPAVQQPSRQEPNI